MNFQKLITFKTFFFIIFLALHFLLLNINVAEWGDSYRILRAGEFVRDGTYPEDEKRPPLFSIILAARPEGMDQVLFGRIVVLLFSIGSLIVFDRLIERTIPGQKYKKLALAVFVLNPVYLYWSLRVMADIPFSFFVLLALYFLLRLKSAPSLLQSVFLGFLAALASLVRFEGYLLFLSLGVGLVFIEGFNEFKDLLNVKPIIKRITNNFTKGVSYIFGFVIGMLPYWLYRSPVDSKYFSEPASRTYGLEMVSIYLVSLLFVMGSVFAVNIIWLGRKNSLSFLLKNPAILTFIVLELVLILLWPAAVPRLFVPIIPFLVILFIFGIEKLIETKQNPIFFLGSIISMGIFIIGQYFLRLQFLGIMKIFFAGIVITQLLVLTVLYFNKTKLFLISLLTAMAVWAFSTIYTHKDIFISVKNAGEYAFINLTGTVIYNDVSSVSDWYLNQKSEKDAVSGFYYNTESKDRMSFDSLAKINPDYLLITNEHNTTMELDINSRPYLKELKEFRYNVNGEEFFTKIIRFYKDYKK